MNRKWIAAAVVLAAACSQPATTASNGETGGTTETSATASTTTASQPPLTMTSTPPALPPSTTAAGSAAPLDFPAQAATPLAPHEATADVKRTTVDEAKELVDSGAVTVIDVRDAAAYAQGHIPGALHMPLARIQSEPNAIPAGKPILAYCT